MIAWSNKMENAKLDSPVGDNKYPVDAQEKYCDSLLCGAHLSISNWVVAGKLLNSLSEEKYR